MTRYVRDNALGLSFLAIFVASVVGQTLVGLDRIQGAR